MSEQQLFLPADMATWIEFAPGKRRRILLHTPQLMQVESQFEAGLSTAPHAHFQVQVSYVLAGHLLVQVGDTRMELSPGGSFIVPSGVAHGATTLSAVTLLDTFTPARPDYL